MSLCFITGNEGKYEEVKLLIPSLIKKDFDLTEIQEIDPYKIIAHKLVEGSKLMSGGLIVEDTSLYIHSMNGLPGPLIKWFMKSVGNEGIAHIASTYSDKSAIAKTIIGYLNDKKAIAYFEGEVEGTIVDPRGDNGFGWDAIFQPKGSDKTFAEMELSEKMKFSMRRDAVKKLVKILSD